MAAVGFFRARMLFLPSRMETIASFCGRMQFFPSADASSCFLLQIPSYCGREQFLPSADGSNGFLLRIDAIGSFCGRVQVLPPRMEAFASFSGRMQFLPSADGSNCFLLRKDAIPFFSGRKERASLPRGAGLYHRRLERAGLTHLAPV